MDWKNLFLTADGRIGKKDFWIAWLILFAAGFVAGLIPVIGGFIGLALIYPNVCIFSKRLHDFDKTGWLAALPYVVSIVCVVLIFVTGGGAMLTAAMAGNQGSDAAAAAAAMGGVGMAMLWVAVMFLFGIGFLLWVGLTNGTPGPNKYGPPPGESVPAAV